MVSLTITEWLSRKPKWLQSAAKRLLESSELNESAISVLTVLCQQETNDEFPDIDYSIPTSAFDTHDSEEIRLCSISEIAGVNKLAPQKPLNFGASNIAVIYGHNGSGKSGYVRLLKHICGARDCIRGQLHKNVFSTEDVVQKAKISFLKDNSSAEHEWSSQSVCDDLRSVDIFDTSFGQVFMGSEDEVSYEPQILSFFSMLIDVCEKVAAKLDSEAGTLKSKMPSFPNSLLGFAGADWLGKVNAKKSTDEIETHCSFTPENKTELQDIQKRISEQSPADKAKQLKNKKTHVDNIINDRLSKAKRLLSEHGKEVYEPYAKALCSDFRILLERMIECELIADVVQRYRRAINTMGKIGNLAKISEADCTYFDDLMTKYSRYEHFQPLEAPVPLPEPDELESAFNGLKQWQAEFKMRPLTPVLQEAQ